MNLTKPTEIKKLFEEFGIAYAKKEFGQNFLVNKGVLKKIVDASDLKKDDVVLEVGPGPGVLTLELAKKVKKVIAVERDKKMVKILERVLEQEDIKNVKILNADILKLNIEPETWNIKRDKKINTKTITSKFQNLNSETHKLQTTNYKLIANIPYNITSSLIRKFLETKNKPTEIILMIQKEVAQRICKKDKMSLLSLSVLFYAEPKILFYVSKKSFFPAPKVDSAIIKITPKENLEKNPEIFFKLIKAGFSSPRKLLIKNLSEGLTLEKDDLKKLFEKINLNPKIRAEDLKLQDWLNLSGNLIKNKL